MKQVWWHNLISMIEIYSVLALFLLLVLSSAAFFVAKRIKIPYTVLLVLIGLLLVPIVQLPLLEPLLGFMDDLKLTPELLFYIFLPVLIFESAYNMNVRKMVESSWSILSLAVLGLLISTALISTALYFILPLIGLPIPFIMALLFGAIISSTDPVAVLALFKEYGAPKRLTLMFEGESLFNDGTAVALFLVILAVAQEGFNGASTVFDGILTFVIMVLAGVALGIIMAIIFSRALRYTRSNEFVSVTLLIVSAHIVFILGELINEHGFLGLHFHVSSIIATTIAALFLGNYSRHILSPRSEEYTAKSIEHLAFVANSLVFILAGILFASTNINLTELGLPILVTVLIVATARAISVYSVLIPLNKLGLEDPIPGTWQKLLAWGSLRGALAIIVILLIPPDFRPAGWIYPYSPQELLLALTIGCVLATLFVKALTIGPLVQRFKVNAPSPLEEANEIDLGLYYLLSEHARFTDQKSRGFVRDENYHSLLKRLMVKIEDVNGRRNSLYAKHGKKVFEQSLHSIAIDIEDHYLKELYINGEVNEAVYRRIKGKLNLQKEKTEQAQYETINPSVHTDRKDVFDRMIMSMQKLVEHGPTETPLEEKLQYYRAQSIISRKVVKTLKWMQHQYGKPVFIPEVHEKVVGLYEKYRVNSSTKADALLVAHAEELSGYLNDLSKKSLHASGNKALRFFKDRGIANESMLDTIEHRYTL